MTVKGGNTPACAACKYQRRRCSSECILAPYFPANQTKAFQNAHRLFGVSGIMRILKQLSTDNQREEAMKSIKYEADIRERFPVLGSTGVIRLLQYQINEALAELCSVYGELEFRKLEEANYRSLTASNSSSSPSLSHPPYLHMGFDNSSDTSLSLTHQQTQSSNSEIPFFLSIDDNDNDNDNDNDHRLGNYASHHHHNFYSSGAYRSAVGTELPYYNLHPNDDDNNSSINNFIAPNLYQDFRNEMPFYNATGDRQSYIETKETCESRYESRISESSSESSSIESQQQIKHASEIELKNAAACFTLKHIK